jgi:hypothetical protein
VVLFATFQSKSPANDSVPLPPSSEPPLIVSPVKDDPLVEDVSDKLPPLTIISAPPCTESAVGPLVDTVNVAALPQHATSLAVGTPLDQLAAVDQSPLPV